jgi:acyl-CoA synthetase (AMP-forming)/AMP-acid ligase II/SAM-dependent methyltransferase
MDTTTGGFPRTFPHGAFWAGRAALDDAGADAAAMRLWSAARPSVPLRGARVLDVGCGRGEIARAFARLGARVAAIDGDPERIAEARSAPGAGAVLFALADAAEGLPSLSEGPYDLAYCHYAGWGYGGAEAVRATFLSVETVLGQGRPFLVEIYDGRAVLGDFRGEIAYPGPNGRPMTCRGTLDAPVGAAIARVDQVWDADGLGPVAVAFEPMTPEALSGLAACAGFGAPGILPAPALPASTPGAPRLILRFTREGPRPVRGRLHARLHAALSARADGAVLRDGPALSGRDCLDFAARTEALLRGLPRRPGTRLAALLLPRCYAFPLALMAARAAGYAFLPLDPAIPDDRLRGILARARPDVVLCLAADADRAGALAHAGLRPRGGGTVLPPAPGLEALAAVPLAEGEGLRQEASHLVFTSGSSGRPKGVLLREGGLLDTIDAQVALLPAGPGPSHWLLSPGFDASLSDVLCPLLGGRTLEVHRPPATRTKELRRALSRGGVADLPPAMVRLLRSELAGLDAVVFGGERAPVADVLAIAGATRGLQAYGPTEASVCAMVARPGADWIPGLLGRPLVPGTVHLVTASGVRHRVEPAGGDDFNAVRLFPAPEGDAAEGEIVISGSPVALGYLDDPEAAAIRFGSLGGRRAHMTGDLARYRDGRVAWVGRTDRQFKRNGLMVCPEEIEGLAEAMAPGLSACCIRDGEAVVLAFAGQGTVPEGVAGMIADRLGPAFRPTRVVRLAELPLSAAGKPDLARVAEEAARADA